MWTTQQMPGRDMSFKPIDLQSARTIPRAQAENYNELGFTKPFVAHSGDEIVDARVRIDRLFDLLKVRGEEDSYALLGYHTRCQVLYDIAMNPRILNVVQDVIGPDIICWTSQVFCKLPMDPKSVPFHQDASYWPLTPARTVSAWLAIDDADRENSCLEVIPRTHNKGQLSWSKTTRPAVLDQEIDDLGKFDNPVCLELKAGEFSIHADLTAHGSKPNRSTRRRCGYVMRFCPPSVKPLQKSWALNAILCRGVDTHGYWTFSDRPDGDDVESWATHWERKVREGKVAALAKGDKAGEIGA